jgi:hypothetical protein
MSKLARRFPDQISLAFSMCFPCVYLVRALRDARPSVVRGDRRAIHFLPQCAALAVEAVRSSAVARAAIVP